MSRLERLVGALNPKRWPVRWRVAAVSASLTLVILVAFALVVGRLTSNRIKGDFNDEVRDTAARLAPEVRITQDLVHGLQCHLNPGELAVVGNAAARVVTSSNVVCQSIGAPNLGRPRPGSLATVGSYRVATAALPQFQNPPAFIQYARDTGSLDATIQSPDPLFVEYARNTGSVEATIQRLWLFLGLGVLGGTALAALAGMAVAGRAMRPIARLTQTAREIASTRDPSRRMPEPETEDEVGELARTLDQMLRELDARRSETELMMELQREFVADASHELRTPLTSILANLELLSERLAADQTQGEESEIVESALRSSRRMSRLVSDLLLLARADAGRTGPRQECDLAEVAAAAVSEARPVANGHRLTLTSGGPIPVKANPDELHRLALNLIDNGLRHTPPGTEIHVATERRDGDAVLEVSDDGPGLPAGMEEQVFSRFVRGPGPADLVGDTGTGLGLAIVKAVATSHGGEVEAGSSRAGGARFVVRLPLPKV
jgi:signal transduction histidine kinase